MSGTRPAAFRYLFSGLALGGGLGYACYCLSGNSLDYLIAPLLLGCLLMPCATAIAGRLADSFVIGLGFAFGVGLVWTTSTFAKAISWVQLTEAMLLLATLCIALASLTHLLLNLRLNKVIMSASVVTVSLGWLTYPIWLANSLSGARLNLMVKLHPLFVMNHIVYSPAIGMWSEQSGAYRLTTFGQDVQYQLPTSIWPIVLFHGAIVLAGVLTWLACRMASRSMNQIETEASAISSR